MFNSKIFLFWSKNIIFKTLRNIDKDKEKYNLAASLQKSISDCLLNRTELL